MDIKKHTLYSLINKDIIHKGSLQDFFDSKPKAFWAAYTFFAFLHLLAVYSVTHFSGFFAIYLYFYTLLLVRFSIKQVGSIFADYSDRQFSEFIQDYSLSELNVIKSNFKWQTSTFALRLNIVMRMLSFLLVISSFFAGYTLLGFIFLANLILASISISQQFSLIALYMPIVESFIDNKLTQLSKSRV